MLILASASPRRSDLLARVGVAFEVRPSDVDESQHPGEHPDVYVQRVATAKAIACACEAGQWVLSADTIVELDGELLAKAADAAEARSMLQRLAGRTHRVRTAVCLRRGDDGATFELAVDTHVDMVAADAAMVDDYVASDDWQGKAGAYALQGIGAALVASVRGSVTNVVGLPLAEVVALLQRSGAAEVAMRRGRLA